MITEHCDIYVRERGFINVAEVSPGDTVYTLDLNRDVRLESVSEVTSDFFSGKINRIDSGAHNVDVTNDARLFYLSETKGPKLISFKEIPGHTPNKEYSSVKYLPVLSWKEQSCSKMSDKELESIARRITVDDIDGEELLHQTRDISGTDALLLVDMLEFWLSESPGVGWFERASVKSRSHKIKGRELLDEMCRIAILAGCTAAITAYSEDVLGLKISYESMPIPGSRPKNEKYHPEYYTGNVYNVNAKNLPILGRSRGRIFYLPTTSTLLNDTIE